MQNFLEAISHAYGQCHKIRRTVHLYGFSVLMQPIVYRNYFINTVYMLIPYTIFWAVNN